MGLGRIYYVSRELRPNHEPGAIFHVMNRGVAGMTLFSSPAEYALFLNIAARVRDELPFLIHCFCLMPNHFHILLELLAASMSEFMQKLETAYAKHFNHVRSRRGPVFQDRFNAVECFDETYYRTVVRYIARNPVKAGLASTAEEWPWSSHKQILTPTPGSMVERSLVLRGFGVNDLEGVKAYADFVSQEAPNDDAIVARSIFPSDAERSTFAPWSERDIRALLDGLADGICRQAGVSGEILRAPANKTGVALRARFALEAGQRGFSLSQTAEYLGLAASSLSRAVANVQRK